MIGNLQHFWRITRELDLNGIRESFERASSVAVLGSDWTTAQRYAGLIASGSADDLTVGTLAEWASRPRDKEPDAFVVVLSQPPDTAVRRTLTELSIGQAPLLLVQTSAARDVVVLGVPEEQVLQVADDQGDEALRDSLLDRLVVMAPEAMLPLGRRNPALRDAVADHLIRDAARVNAQFAALSSLPAVVPLVGGVVGNVADILVLTKNQVVLLFKLAGLYGRNLELGQRVLIEVLPVVGGAFIWRTAARGLAGFLPPIVSVVPKTVIAYAGTYVVGELARYYYCEGRKPPEEVAQRIGAEALRLAQVAASMLGGGPPRLRGS